MAAAVELAGALTCRECRRRAEPTFTDWHAFLRGAAAEVLRYFPQYETERRRCDDAKQVREREALQ